MIQTGSRGRCPPRRRAGRGELGGGIRGGRRRALAGARRGRPRRGRRLRRQPGRPQPRADPLRDGVPEGARLEEHLLGVDGRPDAEAGLRRADVRRRAQRPGPRRRPHRPPADPRRQPARLQRLAADRARHARPHPRDPRARRQGRRHRSAPQPYRPRGLRAPLHPPRHRRACCCSRSPTCCSPRVSRSPGPLAEHAVGADANRRARAAVRAGGRRARVRDRRRRDPPHGARARGRRARRGLRADRDDDAALRNARELARRRAQLPDRQPRSRGRGDVPARRRGPAQLVRHRPGRQGLSGSGAGRAGSAAGPRCSASCPSSGSPRRSRRPATARSAPWSRSPATRSSRPRTPGRSRRRSRTLDFMVSIDIYVNETTRHADVILPAPEPLAKAHYDTALYQLAVRSVANCSPPVIDARRRPARRVGGDAAARRDRRRPGSRGGHRGLGRARRPHRDRPRGRLAGLADRGTRADEILEALGDRRGPERLLDFMLRVGPFGDGFGADPDGLTLEKLEANPHGLDFGAMRPRIPEVLRTPSGKIELAPREIVADVPRLEAELGAPRQRRDGPDRPPPAALQQLLDAQPAGAGQGQGPLHGPGQPGRRRAPRPRRRRPRAGRLGVGELVAPVEVTDEIMPGVVSIPHGWGHDAPGVRLGVASEHAGVNSNLLAPGRGRRARPATRSSTGSRSRSSPPTASRPARPRPRDTRRAVAQLEFDEATATAARGRLRDARHASAAARSSARRSRRSPASGSSTSAAARASTWPSCSIEVGPEGSVVGVDSSAAMLAIATGAARDARTSSWTRARRPRCRSTTPASTPRSASRCSSTSTTSLRRWARSAGR